MDRTKRSVDAKGLTFNHVIAEGSKSIVRNENVSSIVPRVIFFNDITLSWDNINWSCAYDSTFTMLYGIWNENPSY